MFNRPHHQLIAKILQSFNSSLLEKAECYFGGGTAVVLLLDEYRESVDIDFLCASKVGYRLLRNSITSDLGTLLDTPIHHLREVRADRYGIRTVLQMEGTPVKVEIVNEGRIQIQGAMDRNLRVPILSRVDMYAEKLLANADRGMDQSTASRDIIDLAMMISHWGSIPAEAWDKVDAAYGAQGVHAFCRSVEHISDKQNLSCCLQQLHMDKDLIDRIPPVLASAIDTLPTGKDTCDQVSGRARPKP